MKVAAAAFLSYFLVFAAVADSVPLTVSAAPDATTCPPTGWIVAKGPVTTLRIPFRGARTYELDLSADGTWGIVSDVPGCWSQTLTWSSAANLPLQLHLERAGILQGSFEAKEQPTALRGHLFPAPDTARTEVLLDGLPTQCVLDWPQWQCTVPASRKLDLRLHVTGYAPLYVWDVRVAAGQALSIPSRRLEKGASVAGWVEDPNGDPAGDARVSLVTLEAAPAGATAQQRASARTLQTKTNAKGFFQFAGVPAGTYRAVSEAPDVAPAHTSAIRVRPDEAITWPVAITHVLPPTLVVLVQPGMDARGQPWVAQFVEREPLFQPTQQPMRRLVTDTGRIVVEHLHAGPYEIEIRDADASVVEIAEVDLSNGGEHTLTIDIRAIAATGTLRCGDELLEGELTFTDLTGRSVRATTDAAGRFEVSFPAPGVWAAELRYPLGARASMISLKPVEIPAGANATLDLRVPGGRITGRVTTSAGAGEQAAVHVRSAGRIAAQLVTDVDGTFDIVGIPAGAYVVDGEGRSGASRYAVTVTIEKQETQTVHLRLEPYQWIRGVVRTPYGAPASGALVRISADRGARWVRAVTDVSGKFEYQLPGGTDEVQLIVLTYSYPAVALRAMPAPEPVDITLPVAGGFLRVSGGQNPAIQSMGFRVPIRFLYFPEPPGQYDGGVHLPAGTYVVCPSMNPAAQCKGATVASSSETQITFTAESPKERQ